jgi:hypothetical protein
MNKIRGNWTRFADLGTVANHRGMTTIMKNIIRLIGFGAVMCLTLMCGSLAGTNDLFEAKIDLHGIYPKSLGQENYRATHLLLETREILNLADGRSLTARGSTGLCLGLESNSETRDLRLVAYDHASKETILNLGDIHYTAWFPDGKKVYAVGYIDVPTNGFLYSGQLSLQITLELDSHQAPKSMFATCNGWLDIQVSNTNKTVYIREGTLETQKRQLRTAQPGTSTIGYNSSLCYGSTLTVMLHCFTPDSIGTNGSLVYSVSNLIDTNCDVLFLPLTNFSFGNTYWSSTNLLEVINTSSNNPGNSTNSP